MSADLPLTTHELATIRARASDMSSVALAYRDTLRLVAEIERLRSFAAEIQGTRNKVKRDVDRNVEGGQCALGNKAACIDILAELDGALGMVADQ